MPPAPIGATISYGPSREPALNAMLVGLRPNNIRLRLNGRDCPMPRSTAHDPGGFRSGDLDSHHDRHVGPLVAGHGHAFRHAGMSQVARAVVDNRARANAARGSLSFPT